MIQRDYTWIKKIKRSKDLEQHLTADLKLVLDRLGLDGLIMIWENFPNVPIYISEKPLLKYMERFVLENYTGHNAKELALELGISERKVYQFLKEDRKIEPQGELWE